MTLHEEAMELDQFERMLSAVLDQDEPAMHVRQSLLRTAVSQNRRAEWAPSLAAPARRQPRYIRRAWPAASVERKIAASSVFIEVANNINRVRWMI